LEDTNDPTIMPSSTNKDRDDKHRRRRQVGDRRTGSASDVDGREAARKLYGGFARKDDDATDDDSEPTLFDDATE
jgi:hypothetical protein